MAGFIQFLNDHLLVILFAQLGLIFLLLFLVAALYAAVRSVERRANRFFGSRTDRRNLENLFDAYKEQVADVAEKTDGLLAVVDDMNARLKFCYQKMGVHRYNPFTNMGGDLSFALALLDADNNGFVLTTIHGRDGSYTYAKPVIGGKSSYTLSKEEQIAIHAAMEENKFVKSYDWNDL